MIKRETVTSLLVGFMAGACGIFPVVAGDGFSFGPAQGAASGGGGSGDLTAITETGSGLTITSGTGPVPDLALEAGLEAIAGLAKTDGNVIVGDGSTWVAESGATARASLGALGGSLGATDNVILRSDGTGGVTAQGSDATLSDAEVLDLTATGILRTGSGTAAAPTIVWSADPTTGFYRSATGQAALSILGTRAVAWGPQQTWAENGSASTPAYSFWNDANTGLYSVDAGNLGFAAGGAQIASVNTRGLTRRVYVEAATGSYTLADAQSDRVYHNTGAGGAITVELGSITATGFATTWVATDNQDVTINPGDSDKFVGLAGGWADGEAMILDDQNDAVRLVRLSTGDWLVEWTRGTLTEETP